MVRNKGTLNNFMADAAISAESIKWLLRSGKVPIGKERTQLIEREQLRKWGVLIEGTGKGTGEGIGVAKPEPKNAKQRQFRLKKTFNAVPATAPDNENKNENVIQEHVNV